MNKSSVSDKFLSLLYVIGGGLGLLASLLLTIDKIRLLENPAVDLPCNISPLISCGSVMQTAQSSVLGFPNSLIGIAIFSGIMTIGFAMLAGGTFKKWLWHCLQLTLSLAIIFVFWLFYQSVFIIGSLCPYCVVVWIVTIPLFVYTTAYNYPQLKKPWVLLSLMYAVIVLAAVYEFWQYWSYLG